MNPAIETLIDHARNEHSGTDLHRISDEAEAELEALRNRCGQLEEALVDVTKTVVALITDSKHNGEYVHSSHCNASRQQPVGNDMCSCGIGKRIKALTAERDALLADKERLDDAERFGITVYHARQHDMGGNNWRVTTYKGKTRQLQGNTIRAAIDAARKEKPE